MLNIDWKHNLLTSQPSTAVEVSHPQVHNVTNTAENYPVYHRTYFYNALSVSALAQGSGSCIGKALLALFHLSISLSLLRLEVKPQYHL
jgi:hypothetical protein